MTISFRGQSANEVWQNAVDVFRRSIAVQNPDSLGDSTKEMLYAEMSIADSRQHWVGSRAPSLKIFIALAEVVYIMTGGHDRAFLEYCNSEY